MKRTLFFMVAIFSLAGMIAISGCKKKETYTVTFDANGGTGEMAEQVFIEGEPRALIGNILSYPGYVFKNWNTEKNGTGTSYDDRQRITVTSDMTLYAQWKKILTTVTVTFDANGGSGEMEPQQMIADVPRVLVANAFINGNHPFNCWNTKPDGSGTTYVNMQEITISKSITLYAQWSVYEFVDLGLPSGTLWATFNVGATNPEDYGDYFAWGETTTKDLYDWGTYQHFLYGHAGYIKYCCNANNGYEGFVDNLTALEACDDAATANWGYAWRMPTKTEMEELKNNCTIIWTSHNGVNGCSFAGPNGNSIFMPAAGWNMAQNGLVGVGNFADYWSSTLICNSSDDFAWSLSFDQVGCGLNEDAARTFGLSVRPVYRPHN